ITAGTSLIALSGWLRAQSTDMRNGDQGGNGNVVAFADGGLAYGPTLGLFGEYPGARSNPEVVAPLSDLNNMISNNREQGEWETAHVTIPGDKIDILMKKHYKKQKMIK
ncbi:MAG: hypothetical protein ACOCSL_03165, partial [Thermoplasmatota archaeon]